MTSSAICTFHLSAKAHSQTAPYVMCGLLRAAVFSPSVKRPENFITGRLICIFPGPSGARVYNRNGGCRRSCCSLQTRRYFQDMPPIQNPSAFPRFGDIFTSYSWMNASSSHFPKMAHNFRHPCDFISRSYSSHRPVCLRQPLDSWLPVPRRRRPWCARSTKLYFHA